MILTSAEHTKVAIAFEKKAKDSKVSAEDRTEAKRKAVLFRHLARRSFLKTDVAHDSQRH